MNQAICWLHVVLEIRSTINSGHRSLCMERTASHLFKVRQGFLTEFSVCEGEGNVFCVLRIHNLYSHSAYCGNGL